MDITFWTDTLNLIPWSLLVQLFIIGIIAMIAKKYYDNISSYFMFKANNDLGKNVKVVVEGRSGYIMKVTWRFLYVKLENSGNEMIIPISRWTYYVWEVVKNGKDKDKVLK